MRERKPTRTREGGRGERVLPGVWRLRLPLDLPGVPHCNAWALKAGRGIVLVDTGMHDRDSMGNLERALDHIGYQLRDVKLVVITHAHIDHCGQAPPIAQRARCEVWMHPAWKLHAAKAPDLDRTIEVALLSGVPEEPLRRWAEKRRGQGTGQAGTLYADRDLVPGVTVETDAGTWQVIETPGHAPSHVCLHQPEQRLLISGDHLLGRVSQYFDIGYTPDPVGEFLHSLDVTERARRPPRARRPRPPVHGRPGAHPGQPRSDRDATWTPFARRWPAARRPPTRWPARSTASSSPRRWRAGR